MSRLAEHVDGLDPAQNIVRRREKPQIPGKGQGIAGYVDDLRRLRIDQGRNKLRVKSLTGRVDDDEIGLFAGISQIFDEADGVGLMETDVADAVEPGILICVLDGRRVDFHRQDLLHHIRKDDRDRSDARIGVDDEIGRLRLGEFDRFFVKNFHLFGIDLKECFRGDLKFFPHDHILDEAFSIDNPFEIAEDDRGFPLIDILDDRTDLRMRLPQILDEIIPAGKHLLRRYDDNQNLSGCFPAFDHHVTDQSGFFVFIIWLDFMFHEERLAGPDDRVGGQVLDVAGVDIDDSVGVFFIEAGKDFPALLGKNHLDLVPIMVGILHANAGNEGFGGEMERIQTLLDVGGLDVQLFLIIKVLQGAAAAFGVLGARRLDP